MYLNYIRLYFKWHQLFPQLMPFAKRDVYGESDVIYLIRVTESTKYHVNLQFFLSYNTNHPTLLREINGSITLAYTHTQK